MSEKKAPSGATPNPPKRRVGRKPHDESQQNLDALLNAIQRRGEAVPVDLGKELGLSRSTLAYQLNTLLDEGYIEKLGGGKYTRYRLAVSTPPAPPVPKPQVEGKGLGVQPTPVRPQPPVEPLSVEAPAGGAASDEPPASSAWIGFFIVVFAAYCLSHWAGNTKDSAQVGAPTPKPDAVKAAQKPALKPSNPVVHNATVSEEAAFARKFAYALYTLKYQDPYANMDAVAAMISPKHSQEILNDYYSKEKITKLQDEKQTCTYAPDPNPYMPYSKDGESDFAVKGILTTTSEGQTQIVHHDLEVLVTIGFNAKGRPEVREVIEVYSKEMK